MNIHFKNKDVFESLVKASIAKIEVGSSMYGTNDSESDVDFLYIYATSSKELQSFLKSHHQLQYKESGIDHNFISLHSFLTNAINGDSTINFEVINSDFLKNTDLSFLYDMRNEFFNYSIIRSYLGMARRDIKYYHKETSHRDQLKKICHVWRGYYFAKSIWDENFTLKDDDFLRKVSEVRSIGETDYVSKKRLLNEAGELISNLRGDINLLVNSKEFKLNRYMSIDGQKKLDDNISTLMSRPTSWFNRQQYSDCIDMTVFYDAFENWVNYE